MPSVTDNRWQILKNVLLSLVLALGVWYMVIGSAQVEAQVEMRLDYRGLPDGLTVRDGMVGKVTVRLRGSAELLRGLYSRDLSYTVDLTDLKRGANVLPLDFASLPEFRAYEVVEVLPSQLVLEVEALLERMVPLEVKIVPLPDDAPLTLTHVLLEPSIVTVKGPESQVKPLEHLSVVFDPNRDLSEGSRAMNVAIAGPAHVGISPPVTTLRYTLALKTQQMQLDRVVQLDVVDRNQFNVVPGKVNLTLEVPEDRVEDAEYQAAIRVVARPPESLVPGDAADVPVLVVLPAGARLAKVEPSVVRITHKSADTPPVPAAGAGETPAAPVVSPTAGNSRTEPARSAPVLNSAQASLPASPATGAR